VQVQQVRHYGEHSRENVLMNGSVWPIWKIGKFVWIW
jgi:hypothetical protein